MKAEEAREISDLCDISCQLEESMKTIKFNAQNGYYEAFLHYSSPNIRRKLIKELIKLGYEAKEDEHCSVRVQWSKKT
ncbi:hypothetical protein HYV49_05300 [Candidatus Pacearchaeota archaeon]|nr:hypothetical protein [Candidatus Pacearchaeota archaeon]